MTNQLHAYEVHYQDNEGTTRIFGTYARDALHAKLTANELIREPRIRRICRVPDFDW